MRKNDCVYAKDCHCSCHNCIQYKSKNHINRDKLIMHHVNVYLSKTTEEEQKHAKDVAKISLTSKEYRIFEFEIHEEGI